jgi:glyoxylase-like metal-dependent hydrolase (beta-lactamase superfamily II)
MAHEINCALGEVFHVKRRILLALVALGIPALALASQAAPPAGFELQRLDEGVYAAVRREPPGLLEHANSLIVIGNRFVTVVDAQMTRAASAELVAAIRRLTPKPVRYLVNTHWHDDHVFGNAAFREAWPDLQVVASAGAHADLETLGAKNRKDFIEQLPGEMAMLRHQLQAGKALNAADLQLPGPPLDAATRASYESDLAQAQAYLDGAEATPVVEASRTVDSELVLGSGRNAVHLLLVGAAHTRGDLVAWLPGPRVLAAGDVASAIVPMATPTADLAHWSGQLERLRALRPRWVLPGHGAVGVGTALLLRNAALIDAVRGRARAAYRPGISVAGLAAAVSLDDYRRQWAGDDPVRQLLFALFFEQPALAAAWRALSGPAGSAPAA